MVLHEKHMLLLSPMRLPYARPYARHNNVVLRLCPWHNSWQHPLLAGEKKRQGTGGSIRYAPYFRYAWIRSAWGFHPKK